MQPQDTGWLLAVDHTWIPAFARNWLRPQLWTNEKPLNPGPSGCRKGGNEPVTVLPTREEAVATRGDARCRAGQVLRGGGKKQKAVARPVDPKCCYGCGSPLNVGDTAHFDLRQGTPYCSAACARYNGVAETWTFEEILQQAG